jgi:hypothetical protein
VRYAQYGFLAVAVLLLAAACSDDTPTEGPVTIVSQIDFDGRPVVGTFEVTQGADVLGCSTGTIEDEFFTNDNIHRLFTCESGSNEGTFTATFAITSEPHPESFVDNGTWSSLAGSDDFVGLQGSGEWSVVYSPDGPEGVDTWTGDINYTS